VLEEYKTAGTPFTSSVFSVGQGMYEPNTPIANLEAILSAGINARTVVRADTLEGLAEQLGIPAAALRETIAKYNTYVDGAPDPDYDKNAVSGYSPGVPPTNYYTYKVDLNTETAGGYTAILGAGYYYGTCGGLDVDTDMQVLNISRQKIPGLYAVGQDSMGVLFNNQKAYVGYGAAAQGWAITSGRLAGVAAATEALAQ
jgi:fumarate reductase flavoprotein subunit